MMHLNLFRIIKIFIYFISTLFLFSCNNISDESPKIKGTFNANTGNDSKEDDFFSETINIKNYTVKDGLPELSSYSILVDSLGYIWSTTQNGLVRFDGNNFKVYNNRVNDTNSIMSNSTQILFQLNKNEIMVSHLQGISIYQRKSNKFLNYPLKSILPSIGDVWDQRIFFRDSLQNVWMSFTSSYANKEQNYLLTFNLITKKYKLIDDNYIANTCKINSNKEITFFNSTDYIRTDCSLKKIKEKPKNITYDSILSCIELNESSKLASTKKEIIKFEKNNNATTKFTIPIKNVDEIMLFENEKKYAIIKSTDSISTLFEIEANNSNTLKKVYESKLNLSYINQIENDIWLRAKNIITKRISLVKLNIKTGIIKTFNTGVYFYGNGICLAKTNQNVFWFGGFRTGLIKFSFEDNQYRKIPFKPLAADMDNYPIAYKDSTIYLVSANCQMWKYNIYTKAIEEIQFANKEENLQLNSFNTFENEVFFGTYSGLYILDINKQKVSKMNNNNIPNDVRDKRIISCYIDNQKRLWLSNGWKGVLLLYPATLKDVGNYDKYSVLEFNLLKNENCGLNDNRVMDIIQGDNETIYVSNQAYGGLTKYSENQKKFIKVNADTNALFGGFNQFSPKSNNLVFVSSYARGVSWINLSTELTKSKYNTSYGNLTIDWISDVHYLTDSTFLIRGDDYKWRFYNKNYKEERFFSELGDFQKRPLDKYSKIILNDTIEALPGINCFYLLNKNFEPNLNKSKILIGSFKIDNELIYPASRPDLLTSPIEETKSITLPFEQNSFKINFFDQTEFNKDQVNYEYLLDGYNKNWVKSETKEIDFTNVQPGNYKLRIRAALFNNRKQSKETIIKITINAPWWKSNIAYAIYVIILGVFIYLFVKARTRYLVLKEIKLKEIIAENTRDIEKQKNLIEEKHKEITDSISYAERIQRSFIATNEILNENLKSYYVFFKPKDIVSGDFYWAAKLQNANFAFLTADSTGHGVPGAIMSLLNITSVEKAVSEGHTNPADILNFARKTIIERLKKDGSKEGGKDGMDCSLCIYDFKQMKLFTSSANNSIWIIRKNDSNVMEAIELKADKMPVGKHDRDNVPFTSQEFDLKSGDLVVTLTDGFPDQFGGEMGKKFMSKKLRELLINIAHLPLPEQKSKLENTFTNWIGNHEQVDDVTVVVVQV